MDAIRLFATFAEAFQKLNNATDIASVLSPIQKRSVEAYQARTEWCLIETIPDDSLPDLGYISAQRVRQERVEREWLIGQLRYLATQITAQGRGAIEDISTKNRRKVDSLLRKFESIIVHGISSPLFQPDADALSREAERLAPKTEDELLRMERTQETALRNLSRYLAADHMDVYIATSMRTDADFVSVNHFAMGLFAHDQVRPLKLRYFNPTQSWVDDRVAKGLVEALMLKRANVTIYMAQKSDTFGKDSEASVALGQGKPVIVYVPKLYIAGHLDVETLYLLDRQELLKRYSQVYGDDSADETIDNEALVAGILKESLNKLQDTALLDCVRQCWADFDLYAEAERIDQEVRETYREWLDKTRGGDDKLPIEKCIRDAVINTLIATGINFEKRAKIFREIHPLALQVILSTGVLNGILVARNTDQCAKVLENIIRNEFDLKIQKDHDNYRVVETITGSTIRVISRHVLLQNAFEAHYMSN